MQGPFAFAPFAAKSIPVTGTLDGTLEAFGDVDAGLTIRGDLTAGLEAFSDLDADLVLRGTLDGTMEAFSDLDAALILRGTVDGTMEAFGTSTILFITNPLRVRAFDASGSYIVAVDRSEGIP